MLNTTLATLALFAPQEPETGLFIGQATVVHDPSATAPNELRYVPQSAPGPVSPVLFGELLPQFYRDSMLPPIAANIEISAFSAGGDRIACDEVTGIAEVDAAFVQWGFLKFVVGGITNNSDPQYVDELNGAGGVDADIFSYWHVGSDIPADYAGVVEKTRDGLQMGLNQITGMDHTLAGLVLVDEVAEDADELSQRLYFTISPTSLAAYDLESLFVNEQGVAQGEHAATILVMERNGGAWSPPVVFKRFDELGLSIGDEITALSVDEHEHRILVGTRTQRRELWVATYLPDFIFDNSTYRGEYLAPGGGSLARGPLKLRLGEHVKAVCSGDPGADAYDFREFFHHSTGMVDADRSSPRPAFEVSVSRDFDQRFRTDLVDIFVGNLRTVAGNANVVTVIYYVDGSPVQVDFVNPRTTPLTKHSEAVPTLLPPGDWEIRVDVVVGRTRYSSLPYWILL